jgi:hypothetical protein
MFGLEGSGFVVCLALTLFLIGLVMFYVRQRFYEQESKINQLISIVPVMTEQIQIHEKMFEELKNTNSNIDMNVGNKDGKLESIPEENTDSNKINISSSDSEEDSEEDSDDSDSDSDNENDVVINEIKNIQLGSELKLDHKLSVQDIENELSSHILNSQQNNEPDSQDVTENLASVKVISFDNKTSENNIEEITSSDSDNESETSQENNDIIESVEPKVLGDNESIDIPITNGDKIVEEINNSNSKNNTENDLASNIDYTKLALPALRDLVVKNGLSSAPSKLKKQDCLNLLQG